MSKRHTVEPGDCISSIAFQYGFSIKTVWEHYGNAELRRQRSSPFLLVPGDVVAIPERRRKEETCAHGATHTFKRRDVPERLKLKLHDDKGAPRAGVKYTLDIDGKKVDGTTDGDGGIDHAIDPSAQRARLLVGDEEYELHVGHLPPPTQDAGAYGRLVALGYLADEEDAEDDERRRVAVRAFQTDQKLSATSVLDDPTRAKLKELYGC